MALIGIVFFFAIPRFEGSPFFDDAKKSGRWLIGKLQALREESLRTRRQQTLHIDLETGRIWNTAEEMSPEEIDRAVRRAQLLPGGGRVVSVEFPGRGRVAAGQADIRFYRDGHSEKVLIQLRHGDAFSSFLLEPFLSQVKVFDTSSVSRTCGNDMISSTLDVRRSRQSSKGRSASRFKLPASLGEAPRFTLLEVMVALCILAIVLLSVYRLHSQTISAEHRGRFYTQAPLLARSAWPAGRRPASGDDFRPGRFREGVPRLPVEDQCPGRAVPGPGRTVRQGHAPHRRPGDVEQRRALL
jgi:prepilin-type N-terminal cleavage/methylation domain-containing protein